MSTIATKQHLIQNRFGLLSPADLEQDFQEKKEEKEPVKIII